MLNRINMYLEKTLRKQPTVFHITHPKAGSQWIRFVLQECAPERVVDAKIKVGHFYDDPLVPGNIYPAVYVPHSKFEETLKPELSLNKRTYNLSPDDDARTQNWYHFVAKKDPVSKFVVIRDIRDTLVSLYFSLKVSHDLVSENVAAGRRQLSELDFEDGFLEILRTRGKIFASIQRSWLPVCKARSALLVRYEDLIANEQKMFAKIIKHCRIRVESSILREIVERNSFESKTGRNKGEENVQSHYRKGVSGDWKNYFTDRIKAECKELYGSLLIDTGYEKDLDW